MSKGNLFLGYARGAVGDVVFSHTNGEQIARARNRRPRNPQTPLQLFQRVCMSTSSTAYSLLKPICDHSFQGFAQGTPNQSRFTKLNVAMLRSKAAEILKFGNPELLLYSNETNYSPSDSVAPEVNNYIVSEGSIPSLNAQWLDTESAIPFKKPIDETIWSDFQYKQLADALGLQQGDQITFLLLTVDDKTTLDNLPNAGHYTDFRYCRIILDPEDGDMNSDLFKEQDASGWCVLNKPNPRNELNNFRFKMYIDTSTADEMAVRLEFQCTDFNVLQDTNHMSMACAAIVSRYRNGAWQRSSEILSNRPFAVGDVNSTAINHYVNFLGDAMQSYMSESNSSLYLNQAD